MFKRTDLRLDLPLIRIEDRSGRAIRFVPSINKRPPPERPHSEIAAYHLWQRLDEDPLTPDDLLHLAHLLGGVPHFRNRPIFTTPHACGYRFEFLAPELIPARLDALLARFHENDPDGHPLLDAIGIYRETLLIHPLPDGNGRLARLLFQGALKQTLGLRAPIYPLGPFCGTNQALLMNAYLAWDFDHNPQPLVDFVVAALDRLNALYLRRPSSSLDSSLPRHGQTCADPASR